MSENFKLTYDAQPDEIEKSYAAFQHKYLLKKKLIYTVIYLIVTVLGVDLILKNPTFPPGYVATGAAVGILIFNWVKPVLVQKKLVRSLEELNSFEQYTMYFYDDRIEVETIVTENAPTETVAITTHGIYTVEEGSEAAKEIAENPDLVKDETRTEKSVYKLAETFIDMGETDELIMIFINRSYIHTIPKRCVSETELQLFRDYFEDKGMM